MKLTSVEFQDTQSITVSLLLGVSTLDGEKQMNYIIFSWEVGLPRKEKDANILKFEKNNMHIEHILTKVIAFNSEEVIILLLLHTYLSTYY